MDSDSDVAPSSSFANGLLKAVARKLAGSAARIDGKNGKDAAAGRIDERNKRVELLSITPLISAESASSLSSSAAEHLSQEVLPLVPSASPAKSKMAEEEEEYWGSDSSEDEAEMMAATQASVSICASSPFPGSSYEPVLNSSVPATRYSKSPASLIDSDDATVEDSSGLDTLFFEAPEEMVEPERVDELDDDGDTTMVTANDSSFLVNEILLPKSIVSHSVPLSLFDDLRNGHLDNSSLPIASTSLVPMDCDMDSTESIKYASAPSSTTNPTVSAHPSSPQTLQSPQIIGQSHPVSPLTKRTTVAGGQLLVASSRSTRSRSVRTSSGSPLSNAGRLVSPSRERQHQLPKSTSGGASFVGIAIKSTPTKGKGKGRLLSSTSIQIVVQGAKRIKNPRYRGSSTGEDGEDAEEREERRLLRSKRHRPPASGSESSDVDRSDDGKRSATSSGSDSDGDLVSKAMAQARANRAAGISLARDATNSILGSTVDTATPTTLSSARSASPEVRRSTRNIADKVSTALTTAAGGAGGIKLKELLTKQQGMEIEKASAMMAKLLKEKDMREKKGSRYLTPADTRSLLQQRDEDDALLDSDASSSDERLPPSRSGRLSVNRIAELTNTILVTGAGLDEDDDEDSGRVNFSHLSASAKKLKTRSAADLIALLEQQLAAAEAEEEGQEEMNEELIARAVWISSKGTRMRDYDGLEKYEEEDGWIGEVVLAIDDALEGRTMSISPLQLFSPISDRGTPIHQSNVCKMLLSLVAHPLTSAPLVEGAIGLLSRIFRFHSTIHDDPNQANNLPSPLTAQDFMAEMKNLGAKEDVWTLPVSETGASVGQDRFPPAAHPLSQAKFRCRFPDRSICVGRIMRVLLDLARLTILSKQDRASLSVLALRLSVDPQSSATRRVVDSTLQALLEDADFTNSSTMRRQFFDKVMSLHYKSSRSVQLEVLRALPSRTKSCKSLRRWIAWSFLVDPSVSEHALRKKFANKMPPPARRLLAAVQNSQEVQTHPFYISKSMDDVALKLSVSIFQIAIGDLSDDLCDANKRGPGSERFEEYVDDIHKEISRIDARIRTNTRDGDPARNAAKNALTTNAHALMYQYRTAIKFNRDIFAGLDETTVKRPRMSLEDGQRLLSF